MQWSKWLQWAGFATLALVMAATRWGHVGSASVLPDASWAVFFAAGFYFGAERRWLLPLLLLEAIAIDFVAIQYFGVSNYCVTLAYWFIVPAYSVLWFGGAWLRRSIRHHATDLARLAGSLLASVTACFLLTQGSFYWLGSRVAEPSLSGWWTDFTSWYGRFLLVTCAYVAVAAVVHAAVVRLSPVRAGLRAR